jgi:hypothetical protein
LSSSRRSRSRSRDYSSKVAQRRLNSGEPIVGRQRFGRFLGTQRDLPEQRGYPTLLRAPAPQDDASRATDNYAFHGRRWAAAGYQSRARHVPPLFSRLSVSATCSSHERSVPVERARPNRRIAPTLWACKRPSWKAFRSRRVSTAPYQTTQTVRENRCMVTAPSRSPHRNGTPAASVGFTQSPKDAMSILLPTNLSMRRVRRGLMT